MLLVKKLSALFVIAVDLLASLTFSISLVFAVNDGPSVSSEGSKRLDTDKSPTVS